MTSIKLFPLLAAAVAFSATAQAADLGRPAVGYKDDASIYGPSWTGFYLGADIGGTWGDIDVRDPNGGVNPGPFAFSADGVLGGGTAGYNVQTGNVVFGIEGDIGYLGLSGSKIIPSSNPAKHQTLSLDGGAYGDITGRLGYAFGPTLVYAKGGFAFFDGEAKQVTTNPSFAIKGTDTFSGWTVGGGFEHFISPSWSVKAEYQHFDFGRQEGSQTDITVPNGFKFNNTFDLTADSVKLGVNYHVGQGYAPLK